MPNTPGQTMTEPKYTTCVCEISTIRDSGMINLYIPIVWSQKAGDAVAVKMVP